MPFDRQFCVGARIGALELLINDYKFKAVRAARFDLVDMLSARIDRLPGMRVVPIPTIPRHVRERGFDHIGSLAKELALRIDGVYCPALTRNKNTTQVGADKEKRIAQATEAFSCGKKMEPGADYLLVDDIWTTGSSMKSAARLLRANGARAVSIALLARSA